MREIVSKQIYLILIIFIILFKIFPQNETLNSVFKKSQLSLVYIYQGIELNLNDFTDARNANKINQLMELNLFGRKLNFGSGSGFFISENGYLITNHHVIQSNLKGYIGNLSFDLTKKFYDIQSEILGYEEKNDFILELERIINKQKVKYWIRTSNGREYPAELIYSSAENDLALLKIDINQISFFTIADSNELAVGKDAIAVGFPFQSDFEKNSADFQPTVTSGKITHLTDELWGIQHTAVINPGNSGGPLTDNNGTLIGVNVGYNSFKKNYFSINTKKLTNWIKEIGYDYLLSSLSKNNNQNELSLGKFLLIDIGEGFDIYLDGEKSGKTPKLLELKEDTSYLRIENENEFADYRIKIDPSKKEVYILQPVFQENYGKLSINVTDPEAIIFLDNYEIGKSPQILEKIKSGKHILAIKSKKYQLLCKEIIIEKNMTTDKICQLRKGAKLIIEDYIPDDSYIEVSNNMTKIIYLKNEEIYLPEGEWEILIKSKFLKENKIKITMGEQDYLIKNMVNSETGTLNLTGLTNKHMVFLNDREITQEFLNSKIPIIPGYYTLLVTQKGMMPFLKEIHIDKNKELKLFLTRIMLYKHEF